MLETELFSAAARSATPLRPQIWISLPADLSDNFNNMLLSGFKCSLKNALLQTFIRDLVINGVHAYDSFL